MAKLLEKDLELADSDKNERAPQVAIDTDAAPPSEPPAAPGRGNAIKLDDSKVVACYSNFCRVTGTPEELIIDFGLNNQPMGVPSEAIPVTQRLVVNYFTAKRMLAALQMSVQRHEAAFGVLETDVQRRVVPSALRQQGRG